MRANVKLRFVPGAKGKTGDPSAPGAIGLPQLNEGVYGTKPIAQEGEDDEKLMTAALTAAAVDAAGSPFRFQASGDGSSDDSAAWASAEGAFSVLRLPEGAIFNIGANVPTKPVFGSGKVKTNGVTIDGLQPAVDAVNSNIVFAPPVYAHLVGGDYNGLPPNSSTQAHYNVVLAPGFREGLPLFPSNNQIRRSVFVGVEIGKFLEAAERSEAIGNAALKFARFCERNTLIGSLSGQWFGQNLTTDPTGKSYLHDLICNGAQGVPVTDPAWDAYGLATANPNLRALLASYTDWATAKEQVSLNTFIARDAGIELVKGTENVGIGYKALQCIFSANQNTAVGVNALFMNVFGNGNTAFGIQAGYKHSQGDGNLYLGRNAGYQHSTGASNVILGVNAGNPSSGGPWTGDWNIFIGQDAGLKTDGTMAAAISNRLYVQDRQTRSPIISGEMNNGRLAVNRPVSDADGIRSRLHVFEADSGATGTVVSQTGMITAESNDHAGILALTPASKIGGFYMGRPGSLQQGGISYDQSADRLRLRVGNTNRVLIGTSGIHFAGGAPVTAPTLPAAATDAATTQALANAIRTALINYGLAA